MLLAGLSPSATQGTIEFDDAQQFVAAGLRQGEFGSKKLLLIIEDLKIAGDASLVTHIGQLGGIAMCLGILLLGVSKFLCALVCNQTVRHLAECALDRLLIAVHRFLETSLSQFQISAQAAARE